MSRQKEYEIRPDLYYEPKDHFWVAIEGERARIGLEPLIQETMGSIVAVRFEEIGTALARGASFGSIEAEKHVGHLKMPVSGTVIAINPKVEENPRILSSDPYGNGWLIEVGLTSIKSEIGKLITGKKKLSEWLAVELKRFEDLGWIAHS